MKFKLLALSLTLFLSALGSSQSLKKEVLFKVEDTPVYMSEFIRVYNKNLNLVQDDSQKDVDAYLKLFINYKLKLKEARAKDLHKKETYVKELKKYKKQLTKNYITDHKVTEALIKEAYENVTHDVKANHILVRVDDNAKPEDTLKAYNAIVALRNRTLKEGFVPVQKEIHNGTTRFGEELGWFSGFRMVYNFEKVAFSTPVDSISQPFRTRFGYHIVKVLDKRKGRGKRTVKHLMIKKSNDSTDAAKTRIDELYKKIEQGEEFEALAKQFSDDEISAPEGGLIKPFGSGDLSVPEFEEAAFSLKEKGEISKPVKTQFGWHIIKLEDIIPLSSFEDSKSSLENKVKRDTRSSLIEDALIDKLKRKYKVETPNLDYFTSLLNENFYKRQWALPETFKAKDVFVSLKDKKLLNEDFGAYLETYQRRNSKKSSFSAIVKKAYDLYIARELKIAEEENLEYENEDYAHILNEYREGLLLFDLMESTIWQAAKTDSVAIKSYFDANKAQYYWPERVVAEVASSSSKKNIKKAAKLMKAHTATEAIKKQLNSNGNINVIFTKDTMSLAHQALPKDFDIKAGVSKIYKHNKGYIVANVAQVIPKKQKAFEAVKGVVINDYQNHKENMWLEELRNKYKVVINQDVLAKTKTKIKTDSATK